MKWIPLFALLLPGCTAARATYFLLDAEQKYQDALQEGAEKAAPYEITLAREFLEKAKEEDGYSDFGATEALCKKSIQHSATAYQKAVEDVDVKGADEMVPEERREKEAEEKDDTKIDLDDL